MTTEKRGIEILARVKDFASGQLRKIGEQFKASFGSVGATIGTFRKSMSLAQAAIVGLVGAAIVRKGVNTFQQLAEGLDDVGKSASQLNVTASSLYLLRNAARENRLQFEPLVASLRTFKKNLGEARVGSNAQSQALARLGIETGKLDGANVDAVEGLASVADAFVKVDDESTRTKLALQLFGEGGAQLLPMLRNGGQALREWAIAQRAAGNALSDAEIARVQAYRQSIEKFGNALDLVLEKVVVEFAPALTEAMDSMRRGIEDNGPRIREAMAGILEVLGEGLRVVLRVGQGLTKAAQGWQAIALGWQLIWEQMVGTTEGSQKLARQVEQLAEAMRQTDREGGPRGRQANRRQRPERPELGARRHRHRREEGEGRVPRLREGVPEGHRSDDLEAVRDEDAADRPGHLRREHRRRGGEGRGGARRSDGHQAVREGRHRARADAGAVRRGQVAQGRGLRPAARRPPHPRRPRRLRRRRHHGRAPDGAGLGRPRRDARAVRAARHPARPVAARREVDPGRAADGARRRQVTAAANYCGRGVLKIRGMSCGVHSIDL